MVLNYLLNLYELYFYNPFLKNFFIFQTVHSVDIWNVIEAFRENGLNSLEPRMEISIPRLESLVTSIYFQLNKRLPATQQIDLDQCTSLLLNWLMSAHDP